MLGGEGLSSVEERTELYRPVTQPMAHAIFGFLSLISATRLKKRKSQY